MHDAPQPNRHESLPDLTLLDRVDELVSALVDDVITDAEFAELEATLLTSRSARSRYVEDMQLHCDLLEHFRPRSESGQRFPALAPLGSVNLTNPSAGDVVR